MAEPLKNRYKRTFFEALIADFHATGYRIDGGQLLKRLFVDEWETMELKERLRHITHSLHKTIALPFAQTIAILKPVAARQQASFEYMFFPDYVEVYGLEEDWETAMDALEHFTRYSSSEFAIRPFIVRDPERTMGRLQQWTTHPNHHVRRLASEGCRPRLPWAMALPDFKRDPAPILPILEQLKNDPSEYVRRSVANNLNDIAKDHPKTVLQIARRWLGDNAETDGIVKHACRSLLKQGHPEAMRLFGFGDMEVIAVRRLTTEAETIRIGDDLYFSFELQHQASQPLQLRIEYGMYYFKSNGSHSRKVFMITEKAFAPEEVHSIRRKQSFLDRTTRKHYPGPHRLSIIVNGVELAECGFTLAY